MSVEVTRDGGVATVTIDRPKALNAIDVPTAEQLHTTLAELATDGSTRVVILTGAGERAFIAGADIAYMRDLAPMQAKAWGALGHACATLLETMPKPTIAAINGFALGGGCELALACDLRYASSTAKLGLPELGLGIIPGWGGTQRLARVCGLGFAKELVLTSRIVDALEAERRGLVNAVFPPDELAARTTEIAQGLAAKGMASLAMAKGLVNQALQGDHTAQLAHEATSFPLLFDTEDLREGLTAFLEKRSPRFA